MTDEHKRKIGLANKGRIPWSKGKKFSPEHCKKISEARKLKMATFGHLNSLETREKIRLGLTGKNLPEERKKKISNALKGKIPKNLDSIKGWNKGLGISSEEKRIRDSIEYDLWRNAVFARDNWTCQDCKVRGGRLEAHHIFSFAKYPQLRLAIDNGKTLCEKCHDKTKRKIL